VRSRKDLIALTNEALAANAAQADAATPNKGNRPALPAREAAAAAKASRTAPGVLMAAMGVMSDRDKESAELRRQLAQWEGAYPARRIDTQLIDESRYANRDAGSYAGPAWEAFKNELVESQGNVQPVILRPSVAHEGRFEVVFGHRRTRACRECGLPVLAVVMPMQDAELFLMMERENRSREDLSPWEQGESYRRALQSGLYRSMRQLAHAVGRDPGIVSRYVAIAELPAPVLKAFGSPVLIQKRWGEKLAEAVQRDPDGVVARATALAESPGTVAPGLVFEQLLGTEHPPAESREIRSEDGAVLANLRRRGSKGFEVQLQGGKVSEALLDKVAALLGKQLRSSPEAVSAMGVARGNTLLPKGSPSRSSKRPA
jgi:ParB family transcriptional regulator, chromosome partitioning protein